MIRVHLICEGQTEETFSKELLRPHFVPMGIYLQPALIGKPGHKGGRVNFDRLSLDIRNRLSSDRVAYCTTFFDFYGLPADFPGLSQANNLSDIKAKAHAVEDALMRALDVKLGSVLLQRFIPYVQMYEYEGLLFSDPEKFAHSVGRSDLTDEFKVISQAFSSPEEINDKPTTAPSRRVRELVPEYEKPLYGTIAALEIGLEKIRAECRLFDNWLKKLEALRP